MESVLYQLFSGDYDITPERDKKQQELRSQVSAEMDRVQAAFGIDFINRLFDLEAERETLENYQYYRSGFLLGARLMLEALGAQPSISASSGPCSISPETRME